MTDAEYQRIDTALGRLQSVCSAEDNLNGWISVGSLRRKLSRIRRNIPASRAWAIKARRIIKEL